MSILVLCPAYNQARFLPSLLQSLLDSTYKDLEIIISDDASTDQSKEVLRTWHPKLAAEYNTTTVYQYNNLGGFGRENYKFLFNKAKESKAKYLAVIEADDMIKPTRFQEQLDYLAANPSMNAVHSDVDFTFEDGSLRCSQWWKSHNEYIASPMTIESQIRNNRIFTCSLLAERELYIKSYQADLFTELGVFLGDYACSNLLVQIGGKLGYIDKALSIYRWVENSESHRDVNLLLASTSHVQELTRSGRLIEGFCKAMLEQENY